MLLTIVAGDCKRSVYMPDRRIMLGNDVIANSKCSNCFNEIKGKHDVICHVHSDTLASGVVFASMHYPYHKYQCDGTYEPTQ